MASLDEQLPEGPDWIGRRFADLERKLRELQAALARAGNVQSGTGDPEGVVTANVGALFLRSDGGASTTLWVKESGSGSTGWVGK
jgi:hypothetical protein